jgi:DNA-binding SARP family transcriptional activator
MVTVDTDQSRAELSGASRYSAVQNPALSQPLVHLLHVAHKLLRQGQVGMAQEVLGQACALAPLTTVASETDALCIAFSQTDRCLHARPLPAARALHPVRIQTLGGFAVCIDGAVFASGVKPQRRPLDVLKLLVLAGSEPLGAGEIADKLWPDSDGDTARNCLQVAVHRLRKLLGHDEAVLVHDRKLQLDRTLCWVDLWAFEREVDYLSGLSVGSAQFEARACAALQLYRGHLFAHETDQAWMLARREQMRRVWLDLARSLGRHYEMNGAWDAALKVYLRALELDPLAEEMYRRMMLCQHTMGSSHEAMQTYHHCRKQLAAVLCATPSAETERLYRVLMSAAG